MDTKCIYIGINFGVCVTHRYTNKAAVNYCGNIYFSATCCSLFLVYDT